MGDYLEAIAQTWLARRAKKHARRAAHDDYMARLWQWCQS